MSALEDTLAWQLKACGLPEPSREYRFNGKRRWRFDFAFIPHKLAIEVEGGIYSRGRHTRGRGFEADCEKYCEATILGWRVLRLTGGMINNGKAIEFIERALKCGLKRNGK